MAQAEEEEWEYEYDENETEDFYIPIDLANVPAVQGALGIGGSAQRGHPTLLKTKLRALNTERRDAGSNLAVQNVEDANESIGKIQIIGLHTENPLMMYNGQLLSCEWNKTIGTDLIFAKPNSDTDDASEPLRSLPSVDLLATGSARLVARVARMRPKDDLFNDGPKVDEQSSADAMDTGPDESGVAVPTTAPESPVSTTVVAATITTEPAPSSFLGRLNAIKARRGETSRLGLTKDPNATRIVTAKESATSPGVVREDATMGGI
ncbi:hypothetical protein BU23DRAFT_134242 [Bimuria novae-zelandiae CBS 107.79]|uniref:Transcription factor TFIIIC triple barrel domain-containing protein n=1 Tax=Bimuria novae-zelandiae CBS 107.79 TaxID=1447943 RepID=A0A6A5V829_9PLEO|nr:hypothetical protein BU23DRAFT_134242 [Bimuria novae-zelandiae CBS 107.79]